MAFVNSKKYDGVQLYHKSNKDISYYIRYKDENNKLRRVKIGDKSKGITENYCYQKRAEILNSIRLGEEPPALAKKKEREIITLNQVAEIYFKQTYLTDNIEKNLRRYPPNLREAFGECDLYEITSHKIFKYQLELNNRGYAPSTINYNITFLGTLFNLAIEEKLFDKQNPTQTKKIKKIKVDNHRERYLTLKEVKKLYSSISDTDIKLFTDLALSTGARLETVLNIQVKDLDLENRVVTLKDLKNNSTYKGFLKKELYEFLKTYTKDLSLNSFLIGGSFEKYPTRTIQRKMKKILDPLFNEGLSTRDAKNRVVIHTLRHTFASHLAINGAPIFTIQKLMNHRDIKQTMRYAKLAPNSGMDFVNKLYI